MCGCSLPSWSSGGGVCWGYRRRSDVAPLQDRWGVMVAAYAPSRTIRLHELCTSTRQPTSFDAAVIISINARVSSITIEPNPSDEEGRLQL